ncbi:MAG: homoserine kinase [Anaerolineae bacterium]|jgi:homoserine kinase
MAVKTRFTHNDFLHILSQYNLGEYVSSQAIRQGTVQTNYAIQTTRGTFMFRYYENRSEGSVLFESDLLAYLTKRNYPCPAPIRNQQGMCVGLYRHKPYMIFEFVAGQHIAHPDAHHQRQLVQKAAELHIYTQDFRSPYAAHRWNYDPALCRSLARARVVKLNTTWANDKYTWLTSELAELKLPQSLPKGICHCDLHFSNVLFRGNKLVALLDFDDANYTFLSFDLVGLIESWAWPDTADRLDLVKACSIVREYAKHRPLPAVEQQYLYDVYKLSILFDCVWYFGRGTAGEFRERKKIEALRILGRQRFHTELSRGPSP